MPTRGQKAAAEQAVLKESAFIGSQEFAGKLRLSLASSIPREAACLPLRVREDSVQVAETL